MQVQNSMEPKESFKIENINQNKCEVVFYTNVVEKEQENVNAEENNQPAKVFEYDVYRITANYREGLEEEIKNNYEKWLETAKNEEYAIISAEVRAKRNELLAETDKEMCLDRLNIELPKEITMTNILTGLKQFFDGFANISNGKIAKYRQELRDIPQQEGFPYDVKWPSKEDLK